MKRITPHISIIGLPDTFIPKKTKQYYCKQGAFRLPSPKKASLGQITISQTKLLNFLFQAIVASARRAILRSCTDSGSGLKNTVQRNKNIDCLFGISPKHSKYSDIYSARPLRPYVTLHHIDTMMSNCPMTS